MSAARANGTKDQDWRGKGDEEDEDRGWEKERKSGCQSSGRCAAEAISQGWKIRVILEVGKFPPPFSFRFGWLSFPLFGCRGCVWFLVEEAGGGIRVENSRH